MTPTVHAALDTALRRVDDLAVDAWLQAFFRAEGHNVALADGLRLRPRFYLGPVRYPLARLLRCCGPDPGMQFHNSLESWAARLTSMAVSVAAGWNPPPLVADGMNSRVHDGNHRHAVLLGAGRATHPVIFWFDEPHSRARFAGSDLTPAAPADGTHRQRRG